MNIKNFRMSPCITAMVLCIAPIGGYAQLIDLNQEFKSFGCIKGFERFEPLPDRLVQERPVKSAIEIDLSDETYLEGVSSILKPLDFSYTSGNLTFHFYEEDIDCLLQTMTPTIKRDGNVLWIKTEIFNSSGSGNFGCSCTKKYESTISDIEPGTYYIITNDAVFRTEIKEGVKRTLAIDDVLTNPFTLRADAEWVYYREKGNNGEPQFIRMRMKQEPTTGVKRFKVYYCVGEYQQTNAIEVGDADILIPSSVSLCSILLNSEFIKDPHKPFPILSQGVESWDIPGGNAAFSPNYNFNSSPTMTWDFSKWWAQYPSVIKIKETVVDGLPSLHYFFDNGLQLVYGVGPVGSDYASNMMYPAFTPSKEDSPLRFLYMRSIEDNHIIYGDPTLDPSYKCLSVNEKSNYIWIDNGFEFGIKTNGEAELEVYTLNGTCVAAQLGNSYVTINRTQLDKGIYIAVVSGNGIHLVRRIVITQ